MSETTQGNVPANIDPTVEDKATAAALFAAAAAAMPDPPAPGTPEFTRWAFKTAETAIDLLYPVNSLSGYLAKLRACEEKRPIKGIIREVDWFTNSRENGSEGKKVIVRFEPTSGDAAGQGKIEEIRSDWVSRLGMDGLYEQAKSLIGRECLFGRYLEATGNPSAPTAKTLVWIRPIGGNQAPKVTGEGAKADTPPASPTPTPDAAPDTLAAKLQKARELHPATKQELVEFAVTHIGLDQEQAAARAKATVAALGLANKALGVAEINRVWQGLLTDIAAAEAA